MKFSIATPTYNSLPLLKCCVGSVRGQAHTDREHLIQDGASTDGTAEWLSTQSGLNWRSEKDSGMYAAINRAWSRASGDIFAWLNADEQYLPGILERVAAEFSRYPETDILFGNLIVVGATGQPLAARREIPLRSFYLKHSHLYVHSCSTFFHRRLRDQGLLSLDESYRFCSDWDLFFRLKKQGANFRHIPVYLSLFMVGTGNLTARPDQKDEFNRVGRKHGRSSSKLVFAAAKAARWTERLLRGCYWPEDLTYPFALNETPEFRMVTKRRVGFRMDWSSYDQPDLHPQPAPEHPNRSENHV